MNVQAHARAQGFPSDWYSRHWQDQLAWLEAHGDADNEAHMSAWQDCMEMKYDVQ